MQAIILLGAPGAGKGTVAATLTEATDFRHVSTGDMLREAVKSGSEVGRKAQSYMEAGTLVPDDVIIGIVRERLEAGRPDDRYMFDGFPRTLEQARLLDEALEALNGELKAVFLLEVPEDVLVDRISGRRICRNCGAVYHARNLPPKQEGVCDQCGGELYQRPDDNEETVRNRLSVYSEQTAPLIDYYEQRNLLARVDAARDKHATRDAITALLAES